MFEMDSMEWRVQYNTQQKPVHNILCLSEVCTFAATYACDWSAGTHVSQLSQSQAEVPAKVHTILKQKHCGFIGVRIIGIIVTNSVLNPLVTQLWTQR